MLERTGHRLRDLRGEAGRRIVRQPVVLAALIGEFRLEEQVRPGEDARAIRGGERLTDTRLEVVPPLSRGIDPAEARPERALGQGRRPLFLPGPAVREAGDT